MPDPTTELDDYVLSGVGNIPEDDVSAQEMLQPAGGPTGGGVMYPQMIGQNPAVSMKQATGIYDSALSDYRKSVETQSTAADEIRHSAESAKVLLKQATDRLRAEKYDKSQKWFAIAQALGKPTPGRGILGTAPNIAAALSKDRSNQEDFRTEHENLIDKYNQQGAGIDAKTAQLILQASTAGRGADSRNVIAAMNLIGRVSRPVVLNPKAMPGGAGGVSSAQDYEQRKGQGYLAGVPTSDFDPYAAYQGNQRGVAERMGTNAASTAFEKEYGSAVAQSKAVTPMLTRMSQLLDSGKIGSGGIAANLQEMGLPIPSGAFTPEEQEYNKYALRLARLQRQPGEGQISNYESQLFNKMVPGLSVSGPTAKEIIKGMGVANQLSQDYYDFVNNYISINHTRSGADKEWATYVNSPEGAIFDPASTADIGDKPDKKTLSKIQLNSKRVPWQNFFRKRYEDKDPGIKRLLGNGTQGYAEGGKVKGAIDAVNAGRRSLLQGMAAAPAPATAAKLAVKDATPGAKGKVGALVDEAKTVSPSALKVIRRNYLNEFYESGDSDDYMHQFDAMQRAVNQLHEEGIIAPDQHTSLLDRIKKLNDVHKDVIENDFNANTYYPAHDALSDLHDDILDAHSPAGQESNKYATGGVVGNRPKDDTAPEDEDYWSNIAREALQGTTFGWGDEGTARVRSWLEDPAVSGDYQDILREERNRLADFESNHKGAALGANVAGSLLTGGIGNVGRLIKGGGFLARAGKAAVAGGLSGVLSGAGAAQGDFSDRMARAKVDGLTGTVLGPFGAGAGDLIGKYGSKALMGGPDKSSQLFLDAMRGGGTNENDLVRLASKYSSDRTPFKVIDTNPGTRALANAAERRITPNTAGLAEDLAGRVKDQRFQVENNLNKAFAPSNYWEDEAKTLANIKTNADANYGKAMEEGKNLKIVTNPTIQSIIKTPAGMRAFREAATSLDNRPTAYRGRTTATGFPTTYSTEYLDRVRDKLEEQAQRATGGEQSDIVALKQNLTKVMRDNNPRYDEAMDHFVDDKRLNEALNSGKKDFTRMDAGDLQQRLGDMNYVEKNAFTTGAVNSLFSKVMKKGTNSNFAAELNNSPEMMDKFRMLLGDDRKFNVLKAALERNAGQFSEDTSTLRNMQSAAGRGDRDHLTEKVRIATDAAIGTATGHPWFGVDAVRQLAGLRGMSSEVADQVAGMLRTGSKADVLKLADKLKSQGVKLDFMHKVGELGRGAGAISAGEAAAPGAQEE